MVNNHTQLEPTGRPVKFYHPLQWRNEQRKAVAYVFKKYNLKVRPTQANLKLAIQVAQQKDKPEFIQDLQNAFIKRAILGHNKFEDDFDYTISDLFEEDFEGEETVHYFEEITEDGYDEFGGKLKAKRQARKVKRQTKRKNRKLSKAQKRSLDIAKDIKVAEDVKSAVALAKANKEQSGSAIESESGGSTISEKIEKGLGIVGDLATAGANIAGAFIGNKSSNNDAGTTYADDDNDGSEDGDDSDDDSGSGEMAANKKYIIAGAAIIAVIGILFYVMKKRKA
jgi:hypothetical protein